MADPFAQFLPTGPVPAGPTAAPPPKGAKSHPKSSAPPDPEKDPGRQVARRLGTYGAMILRDKIKVDYVGQRDTWNTHIANVTTAFSLALGKQSAVLRDSQTELSKRGEVALFIFSLVCAGVMRWAGGFVQYKLYPNYTEALKTKLVRLPSTLNPKTIPLGGAVFPITEMDYNKQMASFVGGMVQDVGNRVTSTYVSPTLKQADPWKGVADGDHVSLVRVTEATLKQALAAGTKVVEDQMDDAIFWMQQSPTFGERWAQFSGGNESVALTRIRQHMQSLRDKWAKDWPYFGKDPKPFTPSVLADSFERGLWAEYIESYFTDYFKKDGGFTRDDVFSKRLDHMLDEPANRFHTRMDYQSLHMDHLGIANALVVELKRLNVVIAETKKGAIEQFTRTGANEGPAPVATVKGDVDSWDEIRSLWQWAENYPAGAAASVKSAGAEGVPRTLPAIPSYSPPP
jgi:hypothetical protein